MVERVGIGPLPTQFNAPKECEHDWIPVSFVFETQGIDIYGRLNVKQPDMNAGKVYFICVRCASHTYMGTQWIGYRMYGSQDILVNPEISARERGAWNADNQIQKTSD